MARTKTLVGCAVVIACSFLTAGASCFISDSDLEVFAAVLRFNANELNKAIAELRDGPEEPSRDFSVSLLENTTLEYVLPHDCDPPPAFLRAIEPHANKLRAVLPESPSFGLKLVFGQLTRQGDDVASVEMDVWVGERAIKGLTILLDYRNELWTVTDVSRR